MTGKLKSKEFEILDSIRGIASLYVAISHARGVLWMGGDQFMKMFPVDTWGISHYMIFGTSMLTRLAGEFVIVFFVLSGFSIAHSLSSNQSVLQFYKRRFIRIYPSYLTALFFAAVVYVVTKYWHPQWYDGTITTFCFERTAEMKNFFDPVQVVKNLFYMPGRGFITPFWSLTYEVIFYLLAPFLLRKLNWYAIVSAVLFLINLFAPSFVTALHIPLYIHDFFFVYNIYFVAGILLYVNYDPVLKAFERITKNLLLFIIAIVLMLVFFFNLYFHVQTSYGFIFAALLGVLLIVFFLRHEIRIKWLMWIGKFSYTLYITHLTSIFLYLGIYWLIFKPTFPYIQHYGVWVPAVFFSLILAYIQYVLVESKTKNILNALRRKKDPLIN
jgi:peptidoglycan/LPS O-acetylase OafA/YrhL